jgi:sialic acid synthase SpsE
MNAMKVGQVISEGDIAVLRTEKVLTPGISPEYLDDVIGKTLARDVEAGEGVLMEALIN